MAIAEDQPVEDLEEDDTWRHPGTLAVSALVLAVLSLIGAQVFRGSVYTLPFAPHDNGIGEIVGHRDYLVAGAFVTAAFALLPISLAKLGLGRLVPSDRDWMGDLLRAAMVLGVISLVLHTTQALLALKVSDTNISQLLF
jgi:hypothetical protein